MKPAERQQWIIEHMQKRELSVSYRYTVDVLNRDFVDEYVDATGAKADCMPYGADKCPTLGRDLAALHKAGKLDRYATGLQGLAGMGFPRWVYVYRLKQTATAEPR